MTRTPLAACPGCARHVRVNEPACPFCRAELPSSFRQLPPPPSPAKRLSRAALYALGVGALAATAAACGSPFSPAEADNDSGPMPDSSTFFPPYGGVPADADVTPVYPSDARGGFDSAGPADADVTVDTGADDARGRRDSAVPADAGPAVDSGADDARVHLDSSVPADANVAQDASVDDASASLDSAGPVDAHVEDHITIRPLYGAPIIVGQ
jgi:hypothetical protein